MKNTHSPYDDLMRFQRQTEALGQIAWRLMWDQDAMMPSGAAQQRSEEHAAIEAVLHGRRTDSRLGDWLAAIEDDALDMVGRAQMRHIRRDYARRRKVPADLAVEIARVASLSQQRWAQARQDEDISGFLPLLEQMVALKQQEGQALAQGGDVYDVLADEYEPEMSGNEIARIFASMRPSLVALRQAVQEKAPPAAICGHFPADKQLQLARKLARVFGYDFNRGRLDVVVHPFCAGSGQDVRITTRTDEANPFNCLYSTIHESGHAGYEQNIRAAFMLTPLGRGCSMGVHESQSRIYENQLGRSRAFCGWLYPQMRQMFGDFGVADADAFYGAVNRVEQGYIRTEADELQYNLHIMLRFDLERALMRGELAVRDLEAAWNDRFAADFGYPVDKPSNGMLQDVHWSMGAFGYFPTYSLGNIYAGGLYQQLRAAVPDLDAELAQGETASAIAWLRENVQQYGGLYRPTEVIARACGGAVDAKALLTYLQEKFAAIYDL